VLNQANGQVALAEATLKLAKADYQRAVSLSATPGAISKADLDKAAAAESQAQASLTAAQANTDTAKLNLEFTDVLAPVDGIVSRNLLTVGNLINQDTTLLAVIVSQDPMYGYFDVDERTMLRVQALIREGRIKSVREGGKYPIQFGLATEGDRYPHQGELDYVGNQVDPSTGTLQVRGLLSNPRPANGGPRLLTPGLFLRVRLPVGPPRKALVVPQAALGTDQGKKFLYVVTDKNVVEYRPVEAGPPQPGGLQVVDPVKVVRTDQGVRPAEPGEAGEDSIKPGDQVIVSGLQRVRQGSTVTPKPLAEADEQ
jgi:multidrug efflux system membrane fusion protein